MTLEELTDYICTKSQLIEDDDREACKEFISKRYELIYNSYLWKDALVAIDISVDPTTNDDNAEGIVLLPEVIDRVVAVRTPDQGGSFGNSIRIRGLEDYYRVDYDKFSQTGAPTEFAIMSPIWFVWRQANASETGLQAVWEDSADGTAVIKVVYYDQDGTRTIYNGTVNDFEAVGTRITVESFFKPVTLEGIEIWTIESTEDLDVLLAAQTSAPRYQRIRLFSIPTAPLTLSVLGKKKFIPLDFDKEEPEIKNLDNCLIAFAMGDMFARARFPQSESQPYYMEGALLLSELAKLETLQAANCIQFIPESGFGDPYTSPTAWGGWC